MKAATNIPKQANTYKDATSKHSIKNKNPTNVLKGSQIHKELTDFLLLSQNYAWVQELPKQLLTLK